MIKKNLLLIFLIVTLSAKAQTSVYHPFPDSDAVWTYYNGTNDGFTQFVYIHQDSIIGDTIIGSYHYHKVYGSELNLEFTPQFSGNISSSSYYPPAFAGGFRQDTVAKRIYWFDMTDHRDTLLYNFNLSLGDTIPLYYLHRQIHDTIYVSAIDSFFDGTVYRKQYDLSPSASLSLIEGIGSTYGLLAFFDFPFFEARALTCFKESGISKYYQWGGPWDPCHLTTGIDNTNSENKISFFPNPFHSSATLKLNTNFENAELKIYNVFGASVKRQIINDKTTFINRDELTDGIYFFQVLSRKGIVVTGKFVIE